MRDEVKKDRSPKYDNNSHLEQVKVRTGGPKGRLETWFRKEGYDYLLKDEFSQDMDIVRASDGVRWWDLDNRKYVDRPRDIFETDEVERDYQLKKNWRRRLPIKSATIVC